MSAVVRPGDRVLEVDGRSTPFFGDFASAVRPLAGKTVEVTVAAKGGGSENKAKFATIWEPRYLEEQSREIAARGLDIDDIDVVVHYDPLTFLPWLNNRTWRSEWPKYRATDPAGIPAALARR